jgi:hypothetical protein
MMTMPLIQNVLDRLLGNAPRDYIGLLGGKLAVFEAQEKEQQQKRAAARIPGTSPSLPLDQYTGKYLNDLYGSATVTLDEGHLVVTYDAAPRQIGDLRHWHFDVFEAQMRDPMLGKRPLRFELGSNGKVARMVWDFEGPVEWRREGAAPAGTNR